MSLLKRGGIIFLVGVFLIRLVSAQYFDLEYFLDNEVIRFALVFIFIFAIVMFSLLRTKFKENRGIAVVISFVIAFFTSSFLFKSRYLSNFFEDEIIAFIGAMLFIFLLVLLCWSIGKYFGLIGVSLALIGAWALLKNIDARDYMARGGIGDFILPLYDLFTSYLTLILLIILFLIAVLSRYLNWGRTPRVPGATPPGATPATPGAITIQLLSPPAGSVFHSGNTIPFRIRFVNAPTTFFDEVRLFTSVGGVGYIFNQSIHSRRDGIINLVVPTVHNVSNLDVLIEARNSGINEAFTGFTIQPIGPAPAPAGATPATPGAPPTPAGATPVPGAGTPTPPTPGTPGATPATPSPPTPPGPTPTPPGGTPATPGPITIQLVSPPAGSILTSGSTVPFEIRFVNAPATFFDEVRLFISLNGSGYRFYARANSRRNGVINFNVPTVHSITSLDIGVIARANRITQKFTGFTIQPSASGSGASPSPAPGPSPSGTGTGSTSGPINMQLVSPPAIGSEFKSGDNLELEYEIVNAPPNFKANVLYYDNIEDGTFKPVDGNECINGGGRFRISLGEVKEITEFYFVLRVLDDNESIARMRIDPIQYGPFILKPKEIPASSPSEKEIIFLSPLASEQLISGEEKLFNFRFINYNPLEISKMTVYYRLGMNGKTMRAGGIQLNKAGDPEEGNVLILIPETKSVDSLSVGIFSGVENKFIKSIDYKIVPAIGERETDKEEKEIEKEKKGKRKMGAASFDLIVGGNKYANIEEKTFTTDLREEETGTFSISNGGSGGILTWRVASSKGLTLSKKSGRLKAGQKEDITVNVVKRNLNYIPHVTIVAKRGVEGKEGVRGIIRRKIAKAVINYMVD
ncbi:MAG: hypothetical protein Q7S27_03310 [Nanoarchaeota archaeon]|nr:hypothetical protein [Nanoarchaeota archaeon]